MQKAEEEGKVEKSGEEGFRGLKAAFIIVCAGEKFSKPTFRTNFKGIKFCPSIKLDAILLKKLSLK